MKKRMLGSMWIVSLVFSCMLVACNNKSEVSAPPAQKAASSAVAASATIPATRDYVTVGVEPCPSKVLTEMEADGTSQAVYQRWFLAKR